VAFGKDVLPFQQNFFRLCLKTYVRHHRSARVWQYTSGLFFEAVRACHSRVEDSFGVVRWSPTDGWKELRPFECRSDEWLGGFLDQACPRPRNVRLKS
jgi:hypothetical protein